ncbi:MAG: hypothetical protein KDD00_10445 [Ignavibacteriae bacterium]|nr:hypothetical protein [Ignavibacteriota bacterium]
MINSILCKYQSKEGLEIYIYENGNKSVVKLSSSEKSELLNIIDELFSDIDDELRLYVDPERVEEIKKDDKALEIVFDKETELITKNRGKYKLDRLLIPLTGELSLNKNENNIIFLTGNPDYAGSPLSSNCNENTLKRFLKLVDN